MMYQSSAAGPPTAHFDAIVEKYQSALLRYAARLIRDEDGAQDIVQETFVRYLKSSSEHGRPRQLSAWLYRVTHNLCVDLIHKERRMRETTQQIDPPPAPPPPSAQIVAGETRRRLDALLDRLTENQRNVLILKMQEGKTYREIGEITGLTVSNVGYLIHHGLKRMGEFVRKEELIES